MGVVNPAADPNNVVQALVYTLLDVFDATRDLYQTLKVKEKRDYELSLRSKGYPSSRRIEYVEDGSLGKDEDLVMDKAAVTRQFEIGYQKIGAEFAVGDVLSQTDLQSQIIVLQNVLVATFLYGPTSNDSISHQLVKLNAASRTAGTSTVDILAAQLQRQQAQLPLTPRSSHSPPPRSNYSHATPYPVTTHGTSSASTSLVRYQDAAQHRSSSPVNTTVLEWRGRPKPERTDTDTTSMTGPTSYGMKSPTHDLFCLYAMDLQRHPSQELSTSITSDPVPYCPHCKRTLHLSPGKAWEVCKNEDGYERVFQVSNRFVVKCHRGGADGQYSCVLCSQHASVDSVCGDVKALIKHIWEDHDIAELKHEEDITEVVELAVDRRRDSGIGYSTSRSSRRSASLGPSSRRSRPAYDY
ncbi:hypothetical protein CC86DRAFT_121970 [Ophiobolus disseminans]|uniref:Uncharacterized protein n=1 Tax=Ophiobolus disseminans TaxID=1469910 RepID=A0A6A6ZI46_9PLEO|nr:hypothetical protein CC86DRAFT_121970 [Ophiobolus disseminans]